MRGATMRGAMREDANLSEAMMTVGCGGADSVGNRV